MDRDVRWFDMSVGMQISNIGSEVNRALRWKNRGDKDKMMSFYNKAIELLNLSEKDPKNLYRKGEFDFCIEELEDFFIGDNLYNTSEEMFHKYYDAFI